jgi:hypothetical protein
MKKLMLFFVIPVIVSCNSGESKTPVSDVSTGANNAKKQKVSYPYPINYSSQFEMGDPEKSKIILDLWKDYDNNTMTSKNFADTVTMLFPGMELHGSKDSILSSAKAFRNSYTSVASSVDAVISTRSLDKNEDWVLVWGTEVHTNKKNVTDSVHLQETWRLNKDGKVDFMMQFARHPLPPMKKVK